MVRKLRTFGFKGPYYKGKHPFMKRGKFKLPIPNDHGDTISRDLTSKIVNRAGISDDDWKRA
jgi:hypothetical protein